MLFAQVFLGFVFVVAAVPKLLAPNRTAAEVRSFQVLGDRLSNVYGWLLGPIQAVAAITLVLGWAANVGAAIALVFLSSFMIVVAIIMRRKQRLLCECFGLLFPEHVGWNTQLRNAFLCAVCLLVLVGPNRPGFHELVTDDTVGGGLGAIFSSFALVVALVLGWFGAKGWPGWVARLRSGQ